jgi:hypothetical protein
VISSQEPQLSYICKDSCQTGTVTGCRDLNVDAYLWEHHLAHYHMCSADMTEEGDRVPSVDEATGWDHHNIHM